MVALCLVAVVASPPSTGSAAATSDPRQALDPAALVAGELSVLRPDIDVGRDAAPMVVGPDGTAWWVNLRDGSLGRLGADGVIARLGPSDGVPPVADLALAPDGAVWFATGGPATVGRIGPAGQVSTYLAAGHRAIDLDVAPEGTVHFISEVGDGFGIGRVSPSGAVTAEVLPPSLRPVALSVGHGGDVWFVTPQQLVRRTAGGGQHVFTDTSFVWDEAVQGWGGRALAGIVPGPDGTMRFLLDGWMAYFPQDQVGQVTSGGTISYLDLPTKDIRSLHPLPDARTALLEPCNSWSVTAPTCWTHPLQGVDASGTIAAVAPVSGHPAVGPDGSLWLQRGAALTTLDPGGQRTDRWGNDLEVPTALTIGPDGNVWYTTAWGRVGRLTPDGTPLGGFEAGRCCLADIATGADGHLWATSTWFDYENEAWAQRVSPTGEVTRTYLTAIGDTPPPVARSIAAGPDGTLWAGMTWGLVRVAADGQPTAHVDGRAVTDVAAAPDGSAWSIRQDTSATEYPRTIARTTADGVTADLEAPGLVDAKDITAGPDGTVWFTGRATCCGTNDAAIGRIDPGGQVALLSSPTLDGRTVEGIAVGPDGDVWFTTQGKGTDRTGDGIGRVTADGTISLVATAGVDRPDRILVAPDRSVWFTSDPQIDLQLGPWNDLFVRWSGTSALGRFVPVPDDRRAPVPTVVAISAGPRSVTATWAAPAGPVASSGFELLPVQGGLARPERIAGASPGSTEATVTGLAPCVATTVRVRSVDGLGPGRWSERSEEVVPTASFTDVPEDHPMGGAIRWMGDRCLSVGYPDGTFRPGAAVTRQALAAQLHRLAGSPPGPFPDPPFVDVPPDHPFRTAIAWMAAEGIAAPGRRFRPTAPVTRQAAAAFLHRAAGSPGPNPPAGFPDVPTDHPFSADVDWVAAEGIAHGYPDGTFRPGQPLARQAMAALLHRADEALGPPADPPLGR